MTILDADLIDSEQSLGIAFWYVSQENSQHLLKKHYHRRSTLAYLCPLAFPPKGPLELDFNSTYLHKWDWGKRKVSVCG